MEFEEAIGSLGAMFTDMPPLTLGMVLESHSGNMERTVDYLLGLSEAERRALAQTPPEVAALLEEEEDDDEEVVALPRAGGAAGGDMSAEAEVAALLRERDALQATLDAERTQAAVGRSAEADFSRAVEATQRALGERPEEAGDQEQADAVLASMLQNQMLKVRKQPESQNQLQSDL